MGEKIAVWTQPCDGAGHQRIVSRSIPALVCPQAPPPLIAGFAQAAAIGYATVTGNGG